MRIENSTDSREKLRKVDVTEFTNKGKHDFKSFEVK